MAEKIDIIRDKFDKLLKNIKGKPTSEFTKMAEMGFEALVCVKTINEYVKIYGSPVSVVNPKSFLNQKPGKFNPEKAFKISFNAATYYFATDVECYGLPAAKQMRPIGDIFEADVVVINEKFVDEIIDGYNGYPAPQHLEAAYECKFGKYNKSQLRELLGFRRHLSFQYVNNPYKYEQTPYDKETTFADPKVQIMMFRSLDTDFLQNETAKLYDLHQIVLDIYK